MTLPLLNQEAGITIYIVMHGKLKILISFHSLYLESDTLISDADIIIMIYPYIMVKYIWDQVVRFLLRISEIFSIHFHNNLLLCNYNKNIVAKTLIHLETSSNNTWKALE